MAKRIGQEKNNSFVEKKEIPQGKYTIEELLLLGKETTEMELAEKQQKSEEEGKQNK